MQIMRLQKENREPNLLEPLKRFTGIEAEREISCRIEHLFPAAQSPGSMSINFEKA
jgi:hypothetical protein